MNVMRFMDYLKKYHYLIIAYCLLFFLSSGCGFISSDNIIVKRYNITNSFNFSENSEFEKTDANVIYIKDLYYNEDKEWYTLGYEDELSIKVWQHGEFSFESKVMEDGTINYPFFKKIYVAGLTTTGIADKIASLLADGYVADPQVFVTVKDYKSKKVFVIGEAEKNGKYYLTKPTTLFEFILRLGGLKKTAGNTIVIKRIGKNNDNDAMTEIKIPVVDGNIAKNILLQENDVIDIPEAKFFISGEIGKSGYYPIQENYNIYQAIVIAGGFSRAASENAIKLIRAGGKEVIVVNVKRIRKGLENGLTAKSERFREQLEELLIKDGDAIVVPKSIFYSD